jgi:hypothetical protein
VAPIKHQTWENVKKSGILQFDVQNWPIAVPPRVKKMRIEKIVLASQLPPKIGWGRSKQFYLGIRWAEIHVESNPSQDEECTNWVLVNDPRGFEDVRSSYSCSKVVLSAPKAL